MVNELGLKLGGTEVNVGECRLLKADGFWFPVRVLDARFSYGRLQAKVEPVGGSVQRWVEADRLGRQTEPSPFGQ